VCRRRGFAEFAETRHGGGTKITKVTKITKIPNKTCLVFFVVLVIFVNFVAVAVARLSHARPYRHR
jgi:hypothetical protein